VRLIGFIIRIFQYQFSTFCPGIFLESAMFAKMWKMAFQGRLFHKIGELNCSGEKTDYKFSGRMQASSKTKLPWELSCRGKIKDERFNVKVTIV